MTDFAAGAFSAEPIEVTSEITGVTVFLRGAQVTRHARVSVQKGSTTLTFRDLPVNLDPQSIQAKGEGNFIILSLLHQVNYLAGQRRTAQVAMLQDSLKWYDNKLAWVKSMQLVLQREEEMLNANRAIGSAEKGVVLSELKLAVDYYRARLTEIKKEELKLANENSILSEKAENIRKQLQSVTSDLKRPTSEVQVNVSCNEAVTGNLVLTYTVYEAGWTPAYDVRAVNVQSPVELFYNARVYQGTGEDWKKVSVRLSTANPQQQGVKPELQPWFIDFEQLVGMGREYNAARPNVL
ncbi:MAG: mucoidy inhibitor MuiA family protein, partial [Bacteroidales bacterium]|nr:mucoidy inhibitor MuiA family protein [Bacteroidales bacterium]